jgi:hypothetical protein
VLARKNYKEGDVAEIAAIVEKSVALDKIIELAEEKQMNKWGKDG